MKEEQAIDKKNILGVFSVCIALIVLLLILNWFFKITPFQKLQGMPILVAPFISIFGVILGIIALKKSPNIISKSGFIGNAFLIVSSLLYWIVGVLVFGP